MNDKSVDVVHDDPFLKMVERVAGNEAIDAEKLDRLLSVQERILDRQARDQFYAAMNAVQAKLPTIARDAHNAQTSSNYSRLETISRALKPVYTAEGFSTSFGTGDSPIEAYTRIQGVLRHTGGHSETYHVDLPLDNVGIKGSPNKTALHGAGSTLTYGRRYLTCLMFDVATGDDTDGNMPEDTLSAEQSEELQALLTQLPKQTQNAFLKWALGKPMLEGDETVDDLSAKYFTDYKTNLEAKIEKLKESE